MSEFAARSVELAGGFMVAAPVEEAFGLFSPLGEKMWAPGWNPEIVHPPGASWHRGLIFRTWEETGEAVWIVTRLDRQAHEVEYHRVEPGRYVVRVEVRCTALGERETRVDTSYAFFGLSASGNAEIGLMTTDSYGRKMERWERWIGEYLERRAPPRGGGGR